ncbi:MAG: GNAT family N-acetyltransferase [Bacteroidetes bacterium]|nr:GNAT family N-acetyltransferase [Bacteroidota bacterium]
MTAELTSRLTLSTAVMSDALELVFLKRAVFDDFHDRFGAGHWPATDNLSSVEKSIDSSTILIAKEQDAILGMLRLSNKKPWAIDLAYFEPFPVAMYLTDMAVLPSRQHAGIGMRLLEFATAVSREKGAGAIRLDAYNSINGAGDFYLRCGFEERGQSTYRGTALRYFEKRL